MIETERLYFRKFTEADLPWLISNRTPEAVNRYLGGKKMQNPEALAVRIRFYMDCYEKHGIGMYAMGLKETGELIGSSGLQPLEETGEIEVGYSIEERYWRQGYGYECAVAWLKYGFETAGVERIVAVAHPDNTGSWRIMEKCGMTCESRQTHYGMECVFYSISSQKWNDISR